MRRPGGEKLPDQPLKAPNRTVLHALMDPLQDGPKPVRVHAERGGDILRIDQQAKIRQRLKHVQVRTLTAEIH